jgi:hypothetical protein
MQLLCNFSELVTRELERDMLVAAHQAAGAAAAAAASKQQEQAEHSGRLAVLLRSIDCVHRWVRGGCLAALA